MGKTASTSRVLTLVFSDLADSTALKTARGDAAVHDLIVKHREYVTELAEECAGRIIDWAGDGCFLTFETSSAGVTFALRLQQVHAENTDLPGVRIGIHLGEVSEGPGPQGPGGPPRIDGLAVDLAARVSGLAKPGQVLMSSAVYNSARQRLGVETFGQPILWQAHGTYELKGFDEPMEIREAGLEGMSPLEAPDAGEKAQPATVQKTGTSKNSQLLVAGAIGIVVIGVAILASRLFLPTSEPTEQTPTPVPSQSASADSIAVMYFENVSDPADPDNLEAVLASLLTSELSFSESLEVLPRQRLYDIGKQLGVGPEDDIDRNVATEIATRAGVGSMVVGTIVQAGEQLRVNYELIKVATSQILHSFQASGTHDDIFIIAEVLGGDLRNHLQAQASPVALTERLTASVPAFKAFVRGETYLHQAKFLEAEQEFRIATEIDPEFAQAHFWRAIGQSWLEQDKSVPMAQRAYDLIDHFPPSYRSTVEANVRYQEGNWTEAFRLLNIALDIDPDNKEALYLQSEIYFHSYEIGDARKSVEIMEQLLMLDPDFVLVFRHLAECYTILDEREKFDRLIQIGEEKELEDVAIARSAWATVHGNIDEAMNLLDNAKGNHVPGRLLFLALSTGQFELANVALERAETIEGYSRQALLTNRAGLAAFTGQFDDALRLWSESEPTWAVQSLRVGDIDGDGLAWAKMNRAELFSLNGEYARAQEEVASAADILPNNFGALFFAGHFALENDDLESAEIYRARLAELAEQARYPYLSFFVDFLEADIKLKQEDYAEARDLLLHVIDAFDSGWEEGIAHILLSRAYLGLGQPEEAVDVLENIRPNYWEAIVTFPHIRALFILGKLKLQLGDEPAARDYLTRYLSYWGDADWDLEEVEEAKLLLAQLEQETP